MSGLPKRVDTVVVGAGTCGVAMVSRLLEQSSRTVLLVEAGPDWGPFSSGRWPEAVLDPTIMPTDRWQWEYVSAATTGTPGLPLERGRLMGGSSSHNGCAAVWGPRRDWEEWAGAGNPGWSTADMVPLLEEADRTMEVAQPLREELTPWHQRVLGAAPSIGLPVLANLNDLDNTVGFGIHKVNIKGRLRWNMAFAYLDPVRENPRLSIVADALVDRLTFAGTTCTGIDLIVDGQRTHVEAAEVMLAGGAYGSPLVLLRSGVGPVMEARRHGIDPVLDLPGVGRNLNDHPAFPLRYSGTDAMRSEMAAFGAAGGFLREEGTTALVRSSRCDGPFDLHIYPVASRPHSGSDWTFTIATAVMPPRSKGTITLGGRDPEAQPVIDTGYFKDPEGYDLDALADGVEVARQLAATSPMAEVVGTEIGGTADVRSRAALVEYLRRHSTHDYHPAGTCKMGPSSDPEAVVDTHGRVYGLQGVTVCDISIAPRVPRANTNIPALAMALRVADLTLAGA